MFTDIFCCRKCGSTNDLRFARLLNLSTEDGLKESELYLCLGCMQGLGLWCEEHGPKLCMHDSSDDSEDKLVITRTCPGCALEEVRAMDPVRIHNDAGLVREYTSEEIPYYVASNIFGQPEGLSDEQLIIFKVLVIAELCSATLNEVLARITGVGTAARILN